MKSLNPLPCPSFVVATTLVVVSLAAWCSPAFGDDGADVLGNNNPPADLNFGGRSAEGMAPDDGTDVLQPTVPPDLNLGGRSSRAPAPDDGADNLLNTGPFDLGTSDGPSQGMVPDDGADVLQATHTPDLNFGGHSTGGRAVSVGNSEAPQAQQQNTQVCQPKTRLTGSLVVASEVLTGSPCQPAGGK